MCTLILCGGKSSRKNKSLLLCRIFYLSFQTNRFKGTIQKGKKWICEFEFIIKTFTQQFTIHWVHYWYFRIENVRHSLWKIFQIWSKRCNRTHIGEPVVVYEKGTHTKQHQTLDLWWHRKVFFGFFLKILCEPPWMFVVCVWNQLP